MKRGVKHKSSTMGAIRIISGQFRGRKLPVMDLPGLRPTTDRTKETLFNWISPYLHDAVCLDMFAGSGSLGFEALSRYGSSCTFIEQNKQAAQQIRNNLQLLKLDEHGQVCVGDALSLVPSLKQKFDVIFIDPPFNQALVPEVINVIHQHQLLSEQGLVYIECELENSQYEVPQNWLCIKERQTKQLSYRLYQLT